MRLSKIWFVIGVFKYRFVLSTLFSEEIRDKRENVLGRV